MTRRIVSFVIAAALVVVAFTGCAKKATWTDGTYEGFSKVDDYGNLGHATVTIAGDKITAATYVELTPKTKDNYSYPTAVDAVATMQAKLIETGDIAQVDAVAKATGTSEQTTEAVNNALKDAGTVGSYTDGTYSGFSTADDRGNIGYASVTVSGGKITDAKLLALQVKTADNYKYPTSIAAWPTLIQSLVEKQDVTTVDAVSQATQTTDRFKETVTNALDKAKAQ
ncbi:MAG TPA: FMN-binding protein [Clostridia bacterium]|nr:FMN-binding protein [Clostridia bacterium]